MCAGIGTEEEFACLHEFAQFNPQFGVRFPLGKRDRPHMEPAQANHTPFGSPPSVRLRARSRRAPSSKLCWSIRRPTSGRQHRNLSGPSRHWVKSKCPDWKRVNDGRLFEESPKR
jgi:hypothetical protein